MEKLREENAALKKELEIIKEEMEVASTLKMRKESSPQTSMCSVDKINKKSKKAKKIEKEKSTHRQKRFSQPAITSLEGNKNNRTKIRRELSLPQMVSNRHRLIRWTLRKLLELESRQEENRVRRKLGRKALRMDENLRTGKIRKTPCIEERKCLNYGLRFKRKERRDNIKEKRDN